MGEIQPTPSVFPPDPIKVPVIAGTGDGRMPAHMHGAMAPTAGSANPNLLVVVVPAAIALLVRATHMFLVTFSGVLSAAGVTGDALIASADFPDLVRKALWISAATVGLDTVKSLITIFGRLESKFPLLTGSV